MNPPASRALQRAFMVWWWENRTRFLVPVQIESVTHRGIQLKFAIHSECLTVLGKDNSFSVVVEVDGEVWDMVLSLDTMPLRTHDGYRCALCLAQGQVWPTKSALWADHLFEPLLQWANEHLAHSSSIALGKDPCGSTWAELVMRPRLVIDAQ